MIKDSDRRRRSRIVARKAPRRAVVDSPASPLLGLEIWLGKGKGSFMALWHSEDPAPAHTSIILRHLDAAIALPTASHQSFPNLQVACFLQRANLIGP